VCARGRRRCASARHGSVSGHGRCHESVYETWLYWVELVRWVYLRRAMGEFGIRR